MSEPGRSIKEAVFDALNNAQKLPRPSAEALANMRRTLSDLTPHELLNVERNLDKLEQAANQYRIAQHRDGGAGRAMLNASPGLSSERSDSPGLHETSSDTGSSVSMLAGAGRFGDDGGGGGGGGGGSYNGGGSVQGAHSPHSTYACAPPASTSASQPLTLHIPGIGGGSPYASGYAPAFIAAPAPQPAPTATGRMVGAAAVTQPSPVRTPYNVSPVRAPYNASPSKPKVTPFSASPRGDAPPMLFGDFFMKANAIRPVAMMAGHHVMSSPSSSSASSGVGMATAGTPTTSAHATMMGGGGGGGSAEQKRQVQARRSSAQPAATGVGTPLAGTPSSAHTSVSSLLPDVSLAQLGPTGEFGFMLTPWEDEERRGQPVSKGVPWTFSSKTNTLYVKKMQPCMFTFALQRRVPFHPGAVVMLAIRMEFAGTDWREEAATMWPYPERCPLHVDNLKKDRKLSGARSRHSAISRNEACRYISCNDYVELRFPFESNVRALLPGTVLNYSEQLMFTCYNSCSSVKRRPTKLVCSLIQVPEHDIDTVQAHVLGRVEVQVRVCACPGRDRPHIEVPKAKTPSGVKGEGDLDVRVPAAKRHRLGTGSTEAGSRDDNGLYTINRKVHSARNFRLVNNFIDLLELDEDLERDMADLGDPSSPEHSSASASHVAADDTADVDDASAGMAAGACAGPLVAGDVIDNLFA